MAASARWAASGGGAGGEELGGGLELELLDEAEVDEAAALEDSAALLAGAVDGVPLPELDVVHAHSPPRVMTATVRLAATARR
jgi:hypothetical protein